MEHRTWLWWKPLLGIAIASFVAAFVFFKGDIPRELVVVMLVVALVAAGKLLRSSGVP